MLPRLSRTGGRIKSPSLRLPLIPTPFRFIHPRARGQLGLPDSPALPASDASLALPAPRGRRSSRALLCATYPGAHLRGSPQKLTNLKSSINKTNLHKNDGASSIWGGASRPFSFAWKIWLRNSVTKPQHIQNRRQAVSTQNSDGESRSTVTVMRSAPFGRRFPQEKRLKNQSQAHDTNCTSALYRRFEFASNSRTVLLFSKSTLLWCPVTMIGLPTFQSVKTSSRISGSAIHCVIKSGSVSARHTSEGGASIVAEFSITRIIGSQFEAQRGANPETERTASVCCTKNPLRNKGAFCRAYSQNRMTVVDCSPSSKMATIFSQNGG